MTAIDILTHPLAQRLTWTLAHFLWQGALIAVMLALVVELLRLRSAQARYACSLAALIAMVVVVPVTWLVLSEETTVATSSTAVGAVIEVGALDDASVSNVSAVGFTDQALDWFGILQPVLFSLWLVGFLLLNGRIVLGWLATQCLLRSREQLSPEFAARLSRLGARFKISIRGTVFASQKVTQAIALGFIKPVVLLPAAWLVEMPPQLLEAVVAHELAHLRRCDLWVNLVQRLAEAVLFYHPALWWLSARLRRERELCCDELAVAATGQRLEYAEALELTARFAAVDGRPALAAGFFGEGKMNLLNRVRCVLGVSAERPASLWPASFLLGGLSLALLVAIYGASNAQDDKPKPKEGERREGEVRRDVDRPREGGADVRRDGDRPRDGEVRRDGDRPRPEGAPRDGERRSDVRPAGGEQAELMAIIRQLRAEVAELRNEVARLRGDRGEAPRRDGDRPRPDAERRDGDRPRPEAGRPDAPRPDARPDAARREGGDRPRPDGARPDAARPDAPRREGDRPRPDGERREGGDRPKEGERK